MVRTGEEVKLLNDAIVNVDVAALEIMQVRVR